MDPLRVGLVGAGPWAELYHVPMLEEHADTDLVAGWARRPEAMERLVGASRTVDRYDELLDRVDAVAFCVPPDVQAELAPQAAARGRHLFLEKPLGFDVPQAERVAEAARNVASLVFLRTRFEPAVRELEAWCAASNPVAASVTMVGGGSVPGATFATPWRMERGALDDLGPHALDLLDALLGPVEDVTAAGDPRQWVALTTLHRSGAIGQAAISITTPLPQALSRCEVYARGEVRAYDANRDADDAAMRAAVLDEFVAAAREARPARIDAERGLYVQRLLERAHASLRSQS
ncbi:Gfo/Idh/MocA family protein [Nocardioides sp.]|uniref:Gfo/Idh/MocA family protein n=1 Tax=Nocardioides sp. TaxID=35761 RepID=UPI002ED4C748